MTELQASLMAIGGTIVVGVIGYNKWQEYKARKSVERAFGSEQDDVLMRQGDPVHGAHGAEALQRTEPTLGDDIPAAAVAVPAAPTVQASSVTLSAEAVLADTDAAQQPEPEFAPPPKEMPVDDMTDCIIPITLGAPVRGERIVAKLQSVRHVGNKPVHCIGQRDDGAWEEVAHGGIYHALAVAVLMANRSSALNEIEYSELVMRLRQVADEIDAELDVPDMTRVIGHARSLHQFISEHDAQLSINVRSNGAPWAISTLLAALERQGFDLRPDGRLIMPDGEGGMLFSLSTNVTLASETTSLLTLLLDVPRVQPAHNAFGAMSACARMLAARLDGSVVDDGGQPLSDDALKEIATQVNEFYQHMDTAQIPAGSPRALRLFS